MLSLIKLNSKDFLGPWIMLMISTRIWGNNVDPFFDQLQSNPPPWFDIHTSLVKQIKSHVKKLPCIGIPTVDAFKIVETDASDIGYGGILRQRVSP